MRKIILNNSYNILKTKIKKGTNKDKIISELNVKENKIRVMYINNNDYISLTDIARYINEEKPKIPIYSWMRNRNVLAFLGLWEILNNENFKGNEFETFESNAGKNSFYISPQKWIKNTNAIGIISKSGNNGGTYAHSDIAFEFASWLSPEFKLYLITEFKRLKKNEANQYKIEWQATRLLSKVNYTIHTDAVNRYIVPKLTEYQKEYIYAQASEIINLALFGMTSKEWENKYPSLTTQGNIRDFANLTQLIILNNLQNLNAELIEEQLSQRERLIKLNA